MVLRTLCLIIVWNVICLTEAGDKFFFNETSLMQVTSAVIPLNNGFEFHFRTCSGGVLLYQAGVSSDYILMQVKPGTVNYTISTSPPYFVQSHLTLTWKVNGQEGSVQTGDELDKNVWYTVKFTPGISNSNASLTLNGPQSYSVSVDRNIVNFKHSGPLYAGGIFVSNESSPNAKGFVGCIESGNNFPLAQQHSVNIESGCPLENEKCPKKVCQAGFTGDYCEINIDDCGAGRCNSYSTCIDGVNNFTCKCGPRYSGPLCKTFLGSYCDNKPCLNGGVCTDTDESKNNYTCTCPKPYTGRHCDEILNPCQPSPCFNGATCFRKGENSTDFNCTCPLGFTGVKCENNIDDCRLLPCTKGKCIDGVNNFTCNCTGSGYSGPTCSDNIDECKPLSPCLNGGSCFDYPGTYSCRCVPGYEGKHCGTNIDECAPKPCLNGGTCGDLVNDFNCSCPVGFDGKRCGNNIDDCVNHTCNQNQKCIDLVSNFTCHCKEGYTGPDCMIDIMECLSNPCQNNGTCHEGINGYNCSCLPRFNGSHCEFDTVNDCAPNPCVNNGTCVDGVADFNCSCPQGFSGKRCELDICDPNPCDNGGNCTKINQFDYNCTCASGFTGHNCSINIDDCINNTCVKNATCIDGIKNYTCKCPDGYSGDYCHIDIDECGSNPCKNNGTCVNDIGRFNCTCLSGFNGTQCENNINDCPSHDCNNGTCIDGINEYTCQCYSGFNGTNCENEIDECLDSSSCLNGATCINTIGSYECKCNQFTNGTRCELDIDECAQNPGICQNNGYCRNKQFKGFECLCTHGFTGPFCQENIDDCKRFSQPCMNGATCKDGLAAYSCLCTTGWEGKNCSQDINECDLGYCKNGATCNNSLGSYSCECVPGYNDYNCSTDIDECADQPCQNGATCNDHINFYNCSCVPGYDGFNCTNDIDECASNPCQNNGTCTDGINEFNCTCNSNFTGDFCEYPVSRCRPDNPCLNNGTCIEQGIHNYTCDCIAGYGGENCQNKTTISLNGSSYMAFDVQKTVFNLSMQFRTTLKSGVLLVDNDNKLRLELKGDELEVSYDSQSQMLGADGNLTNAEWHHVIVNATINSIVITIDNASCAQCLSSISRPSQQTISKLFAGGKDRSQFVGCLRAVEVDDVTVIPTDEGVQLLHVVIGCPRVDVCASNPCIKGLCIDEWDNYKCECTRPWTGNQCNTTFVAGTFGARGELSSARRRRRSVVIKSFTKFSTPAPFSQDSEFSFFVRTRESHGLIAFMTSGSSDHVTVVLADGSITVQTTIGNTKNKTTFGTNINDGRNHFISISINQSQVDNTTSKGITLPSTISLATTFLGGLDNWNAFAEDVVIATKALRGCLQDTRLDKKLFQFFNQSESSGDSFTMVASSGLDKGCPGEDICSLLHPCKNDSQCQNTWNDYQCLCKPYFGGRNCSLYGCALVTPCEAGGQCLDVEPGKFECIYPATFNESLSEAQFTYKPNNNYTFKQQFSFKIKTRQADAVVFSVSNDVVVRINNGTLNITCSLCSGGFKSANVINNGVWRNVHVTSSDKVHINIDGNTKSFTGSFSLQGGSVTIGKNTQIAFKGCLDNLRVGGALVPFKTYYNSTFNISSVMPLKPHFKATTFQGVGFGCQSDNVCSPEPCVRGNCLDIWNAFHCTCPVGYAGQICNNTANMTCAHNPCLNNATCYNNVTAHITSNNHVSDYGKDRFVCECLPGFQGRQCGDVTDECSSKPCLNGGNCTDLHLNYTCSCPVGYSGRQCEINIDDCVNNNCTNNSTCVDGINSYSCNCTEGFNGTNCQNDIDECEIGVCASYGSHNCTNTEGSYQCLCKTGYFGRNCQYNATQWCSVGKPCIHGNCSGNSTGFYCTCSPGWEGQTCAQDIKECSTLTPCNNNGTCKDSHSEGNFFPGYECKCTVDWTGKNCNIWVNPCTDLSPCKNNATCSRVSYNQYKCNCTEGFGNMNCSGLTKYCLPSPCENGATCVPLSNDFRCECETGFQGKTCAEYKNKCDSAPCKNNGQCKSTSSGYTCSCGKAYSGQNCEDEINFCENNNECKHESSCVSNAEHANYTCNCTDKYVGRHCEISLVVQPPGKRQDSEPVSLIIGVVAACILFILLVILIVYILKRRSAEGTYSPSKQEMDGGRVELNSVLKPPNQERLI